MAREAESEETELVIPIQPIGRGGSNIYNRMDDASWDAYFVARFRDELFIPDGQPTLAGDGGHEFVRRMDEIIPRSPRRISEQIAKVPPLLPVAGDLLLVGRCQEFMRGKN